MGYRRVNADTLYDIQARIRTGTSNRQIAASLKVDKKTVNHYAEKIKKLNLSPGLGYMETLASLGKLLEPNRKSKPSVAILEPYMEEIRSLISGNREEHREGMKAKTAWIVIRDRRGLFGKTSYETYKRFVRERYLDSRRLEATVRIETEPGGEIQIDYGKVGTTPIGEKRRAVYAFGGVLSASRLPYVQFVMSQNQVSFSQSIVRMLSFYGGVTERLNLDNLKSGILKADTYDPTLNKTFAELCDYYGLLADPARPASPKDKGKIERLVPVMRELWKRLTALMSEASLDELNERALVWCLEEYGRIKHGTTGMRPREAFEQFEKHALKPLPAEPFVPASWTIARVHPDQFIATGGKYYGVPASFIGKQVTVRSTETLVSIFYEHMKVREYVVTGKRRIFLPQDFPEYGQPFVPGSYATFLVHKAGGLGSQAEEYVRLMLESGGNLAIRRAQGCISLLEKHRNLPGLSHVLGKALAEKVFSPDRLRILLDAETVQNVIVFPVTDIGKAMMRDAGYYTEP